ncbi:ATP synthase peripheral stalk subunit d, mitochondrial [Aulostomus maculatus]
MAGRRAVMKAVDWLALAQAVHPSERNLFNALKTRSDAISAKLRSIPETPAPINWNFYRSAVANPKLIDEFEMKFKALQIPEPIDTQTSIISEQEEETQKRAETFIAESNAHIAELQEELNLLKNMIPADLMTNEDFVTYFPECKLDKEKYPFWPHKPIAELV